MKPEQIMDRCICLLIGAPYSAFKLGTLHDIPCPEGGTMEDRFYTLLDCMEQDENVCTLETGHGKSLIITSDRADPDGGGVMGLYQKVTDHNPDLVCVDAMYLMKDDRANKRSVKWDSQAAISQDIKDIIALGLNKPVIGTNQAKRESEERAGKSVSNISFSDSYGMDCDMAMEIIKKSTPDKEVNELALSITAAREVNLTGFAIHGNAATDFQQLMTRGRHPDSSLMVDENGQPIMVPVVFQEYKDLRNFFKEEAERDQRSHTPEENAMAARAAFEEAGRGSRRRK